IQGGGGGVQPGGTVCRRWAGGGAGGAGAGFRRTSRRAVGISRKELGRRPILPGCGRRLLARRRVDQIWPSFTCPVRVAALGGNGDRLNLERQDGGGLASGEACDGGGAFGNKQQARCLG